MPRLRVLAGPSYDSMVPITANTNRAHPIKSELFDGQVVVHIKGFPDAQGNVTASEYFEREDRQDITWSIQVQGRFLQVFTADDILFGNTFDRPLKLPWGSGAALKFMKFIDPTLEHDLTSSRHPWALSPLISTMPHFSHMPVSDGAGVPAFPPKESVKDDTSRLRIRRASTSSDSSSSSYSSRGSESGRSERSGGTSRETSKKRRTYFSKADRRRAVKFGPGDVITTDFCYNFIEFPSLSLCLPGGISFDLTKYWDGQPVRFVCCERPRDGDILNARVFWCVAIERVD